LGDFYNQKANSNTREKIRSKGRKKLEFNKLPDKNNPIDISSNLNIDSGKNYYNNKPNKFKKGNNKRRIKLKIKKRNNYEDNNINDNKSKYNKRGKYKKFKNPKSKDDISSSKSRKKDLSNNKKYENEYNKSNIGKKNKNNKEGLI